MKVRSKWFAPPWKELRMQLMLVVFPLIAVRVVDLARHDGPLTLRAVIVSAESVGVALLTMLALALLYLGVRVSSAGVHHFGGVITPWSAVISATRKGHWIHYEATTGLNGKAVPERMILTPRLAQALRGWLSEEHPLRRCIDAADASVTSSSLPK